MEILNAPNATYWDNERVSTPTAFERALALLDKEIARFEASVEECCEAIQAFKASL